MALPAPVLARGEGAAALPAREARPANPAARDPAIGTDDRGRRSVAPDEPDQSALDLDPVRPEDPRLVGGIGRLERDRGALAAEALQRCLLVVDERHDDVARIGGLRVADDDRVAIEDAGLDHRVALDLEREVFA